MTILAMTDDYLVEYESGILTISRYSDGYCKACKGKRVAGDFRDCLKTHSVEKVIDVYLKMIAKFPWQPLYKPSRMPVDRHVIVR